MQSSEIKDIANLDEFRERKQRSRQESEAPKYGPAIDIFPDRDVMPKSEPVNNSGIRGRIGSIWRAYKREITLQSIAKEKGSKRVLKLPKY